MALGNWEYRVWDAQGRRQAGRTCLASSLTNITVYKNTLDIEDPEAWARKRKPRFTQPVVRIIERGGWYDYRDFHILAYRGPQNGLYGAIWTYDPEPRGAFFAGVEAYDDKTCARIDLLPKSAEWFVRRLNMDLGGLLPRDVFGRLVLE
jgi:hypothetical protein